MAIRVFVAEDHPVYRAGLVEAIRAQGLLELAGESADGREALDRIRELAPDVVLLDLDLPELDGMSVLKAVVEEKIGARVLMLSAFADGALIFGALDAGAAGYLSKGAAAEQICEAAIAAAAGETVLSPGLEQRLAEQVSRRKGDEGSKLSHRENEILTLLAEGLPVAAIADRLHLGEGTVKTYIQRAYEKLGVSNRSAAIAEAMRRGILS